MCQITAIYGSPRRKGNTTTLLKEAVAGAREQGATVNEFVLRDEKISPCLEIYGCTKDGKCVIKDDFHKVRDSMLSSQGVILGDVRLRGRLRGRVLGDVRAERALSQSNVFVFRIFSF